MEQARHAASTKRHSRTNCRTGETKPVFLRMMGVLLVAGAALACFGFWRFQTPGIVLGPFEDEPSTAESVPRPNRNRSLLQLHCVFGHRGQSDPCSHLQTGSPPGSGRPAI